MGLPYFNTRSFTLICLSRWNKKWPKSTRQPHRWNSGEGEIGPQRMQTRHLRVNLSKLNQLWIVLGIIKIGFVDRTEFEWLSLMTLHGGTKQMADDCKTTLISHAPHLWAFQIQSGTKGCKYFWKLPKKVSGKFQSRTDLPTRIFSDALSKYNQTALALNLTFAPLWCWAFFFLFWCVFKGCKWIFL